MPVYVGAVLGPLCFLAILTVSLGMLHRRGKFPVSWFFEFFPCFRAPQADAVEDTTGKNADVFSIQDSRFNANTRYYAKWAFHSAWYDNDQSKPAWLEPEILMERSHSR